MKQEGTSEIRCKQATVELCEAGSRRCSVVTRRIANGRGPARAEENRAKDFRESSSCFFFVVVCLFVGVVKFV